VVQTSPIAVGQAAGTISAFKANQSLNLNVRANPERSAFRAALRCASL